MRSRGSHRSGLARLTHPAPQRRDLLGCRIALEPTRPSRRLRSTAFSRAPLFARVSLRCTRALCLVIVPSRDSLRWTPLPSAGPREASSPFPRYYERLRLLATHPASLRSPSLRGTQCARCLRVPRRLLRARARLTQASDLRVFRFPSSPRGDEISQVPVVPLLTCPALRPRRSLRAHDLGVRRCSLPPFEQRRPPRRTCFRGSITRPACSLSTLRRSGHPLRRKTRFRLMVGLYRTARTSPPDTSEGFIRCLSSTSASSPPSPSFAWRTQSPRPRPRKVTSGSQPRCGLCRSHPCDPARA